MELNTGCKKLCFKTQAAGFHSTNTCTPADLTENNARRGGRAPKMQLFKLPCASSRRLLYAASCDATAHIVREVELVRQQLPPVVARLLHHSRQDLAPEVERAVVTKVLLGSGRVCEGKGREGGRAGGRVEDGIPTIKAKSTTNFDVHGWGCSHTELTRRSPPAPMSTPDFWAKTALELAV